MSSSDLAPQSQPTERTTFHGVTDACCIVVGDPCWHDGWSAPRASSPARAARMCSGSVFRNTRTTTDSRWATFGLGRILVLLDRGYYRIASSKMLSTRRMKECPCSSLG